MRNLSVLVGALALGLALAGPVRAEGPGTAPPATLSVQGEGRVEVAPDMATVSLGVTSEAGEAAAALAANSEQLSAVLERLRGLGVADRDVQTTGLSLSPRYNYDNGRAPELTGYIAANGVTVRVRDLSALGGLLDAVVADGANQLNGLVFGLQDDSAARDEARRRAVADAAHRAGVYAEAAGVSLVRLAAISEAGAEAPDMPRRLAMDMAEAQFAKGASVPVASGEMTVTAAVNLHYEVAAPQ